jgi:hypothetical protein
MKQIKNTFVGGDGGIGSRRCITGYLKWECGSCNCHVGSEGLSGTLTKKAKSAPLKLTDLACQQ